MENGSLINLGEFTKPATVLIEKISDAIGGYFKPYQIRRVAQAEADAEKIKALSKLEITELQRRGLQRLIAEEAKKQDNIESIASKALPLLNDESNPQGVEDDWIVNFFDKCRLISDEEMQNLWAKVLAGEANAPGKYSRRTVNFLGSLDKTDAFYFTSLCGFAFVIGNIVPLVFNIDDSIYNNNDINFTTIKHLEDIGLLSFEYSGLNMYTKERLPKRINIFYYGNALNLEFNKEEDNQLQIGRVILSQVGQELALICGSKPVPHFLDYVIKEWFSEGLIISSPYPRIS